MHEHERAIEDLRQQRDELIVALEILIEAATHPVPESMNATEARRAAKRIARIAIDHAKA